MTTRCIIEANPDIAGIGVRVSIYAQALLSLAPGLIFVYYSKDLNSSLDATVIREMTRSTLGILFTGTALLISTVVQAKVFGITVYHALIVLNLSWLNNLTAAGSLFTYWAWRPGGDMQGFVQRFLPHRHQPTGELKSDGWEVVAFAIHFSATGAIGVWVFANIPTFGTQQECTPSLVYWIFGDVKVNDPAFRGAWFAIFSMAAVPLINLLIPCIISFFFLIVPLAVLGVIAALERIVTRKKTFTLRCLELIATGMFMAPALILGVLLILMTEMTIAHNLVSSEESRWTFGQTLALMLVIPLGWMAFKHAREVKGNVVQRKAASVGAPGPADMSLSQIALNDHSLV